MMYHRLFLILLAVALLGTAPGRAADQSATEAKLREGLRATMLQLRDAQNERAALQASQAAAEEKNAALTTELDNLKKLRASELEQADKSMAEQLAKAKAQEAEIAGLKEALAKWKAGYEEAASLAKAKENERAKLASRVILLDRQVADQQARNAEMYKIGREVLARYERFGLGTALTAREPFVGTTRVKLENLVQDYQDKLADQKIKPPATSQETVRKEAKP
jgi:chromosome segregation ATPase